ncbi:MAG: hypothetical protein A2X81_12635 [Desulfobacterales bacterium GWB2_56_26]|nr:MAG: hypothetical protein A2X81_12635 [Desulfobacterales bacterium GWB2_56_26]
MTRFFMIMAAACVLASGCAPANLTSAKWDSGVNGEVKTRCERVDMRANAEMAALFSRYDGWKMIYISEYTTGNKLGTDAAVCFERAR